MGVIVVLYLLDWGSLQVTCYLDRAVFQVDGLLKLGCFPTWEAHTRATHCRSFQECYTASQESVTGQSSPKIGSRSVVWHPFFACCIEAFSDDGFLQPCCERHLDM